MGDILYIHDTGAHGHAMGYNYNGKLRSAELLLREDGSVEMIRRAREELEKAFPGDEGKINYMALIGDNQVRMANICAYTANSINGVSKLHSEIIKESVFHDYYLFKPQAFKNVTNGIAYRRWLLASNPELCKLLDETIGEEYKHDASNLSKLNKYADDKTVLKRINEIKLDNKKNFAAYLEKSTGQVLSLIHI